MKTFEEIRIEMSNAKKAYDEFIKNNSRNLTNEEKLNYPDYPMVDGTEPKIFEVTIDTLEDFNLILKNLEYFRKKFQIALRNRK